MVLRRKSAHLANINSQVPEPPRVVDPTSPRSFPSPGAATTLLQVHTHLRLLVSPLSTFLRPNHIQIDQAPQPLLIVRRHPQSREATQATEP